VPFGVRVRIADPELHPAIQRNRANNGAARGSVENADSRSVTTVYYQTPSCCWQRLVSGDVSS
jgi:hypothetical protein